LNDQQLDYARTVKTSADALLTVINDILDFSKIEAGKLEFETLDFDLRITMEQITEMLAVKADNKTLEFTCYVHPKVPALLQGDPGRLRQILLNLGTNAIKFTSHGEVAMKVTLVEENDSQAAIHFSVRDTGIGIPADHMDRLFQSFSQLDSSTTRKYGGTGLGLAICKQLVEMMDGQIGVHSNDGDGTTFWFMVRLKKQSNTGDAHQPPILPEDLYGKHILAVDDNATNLKILGSYLRSWNCRVTTAVDAKDALARLDQSVACQQLFDLAIIDFMMPNMDGETLGKAIKENEALAAMPMMLLTSRGLRGDAARAKKIGFDAYLQKPIRQSQLFNALLAVLGRTPLPVDRKAPPPLITRHTLAESHKQTLRILLVEDNRVNQKVALIHLRKFGYTATVANNGCEAVDAIQDQAYDLVLMDVQMPEMDGLEAMRIIRDPSSLVLDHDVPVLAMTAHAMASDRERCLAAGMNDHLTKPIDSQILLEALAKHLRQGVYSA
jgi:two-component system sensor histidine kinase/response regulator